MAQVLNDRYYSDSHEWLKIEGDVALIGISDYAQHELGDLVYAEAEPADTDVEKGDIIASIESVKMATDIFAPVPGTIVEGNGDLEDSPELLNSDPYGTWIVKMKLANPDDVKGLMDGAAYAKMIEA